MKGRNVITYQIKKETIMEACFNCYADNGLQGTGIKALGKASGVSSAALYTYFANVDDIILQSTEYCMAKVENDFMSKAPKDPKDIERFINEIPYWTAHEHGKKYRLMYQVFTHPKFMDQGKKFFEGVNKRYSAYAKQLEPKIGIPAEVILPLIFIFVRACVHYAMFEDEYYLRSQLAVLKQSVRWYLEKYNKKYIAQFNCKQ